MNYRFEYAQKSEMSILLPKLYEILYSNMSLIAPTGNSYEKDFEIWYSNVYPAMMNTPREIVLMYDENAIIGYFQYYVNGGVFMMDEIQIKREYQGAGVFSFTSKQNQKSQGILEHLGLDQVGENKNGSCYHYKGDYKKLHDKYI